MLSNEEKRNRIRRQTTYSEKCTKLQMAIIQPISRFPEDFHSNTSFVIKSCVDDLLEIIDLVKSGTISWEDYTD